MAQKRVKLGTEKTKLTFLRGPAVTDDVLAG